MKTFIFLWLLSAGAIEQTGTNDDRPIYTINIGERPIEHAYQGEIIGMFETGSFRYDEELPDAIRRRENRCTPCQPYTNDK